MLDDDKEAILLVLRITRLCFNDLPKKGALPLQSLVNLAIICDKYDLVHIVRPLLNLNKWVQDQFPGGTEGLCYAELFFVIWALGYSASFKALADHIIMRIKIDSLGDPTVYGQQLPERMPPGLPRDSSINA